MLGGGEAGLKGGIGWEIMFATVKRTHTHMHTYIHMHIHTYMHIHIHTHAQNTYTRSKTHMHIHTYTHTNGQTHTCSYTHVVCITSCSHTCTHARTHCLHRFGWSENGAGLWTQGRGLFLTNINGKHLIVWQVAGSPSCQETNCGETLFRVFRKRKRKSGSETRS